MSEWISVNKKLPEHLEPVLIFIPDAIVNKILIGYLHPDEDSKTNFWRTSTYHEYGHIFYEGHVTYWMPLPEFPTGEFECDN